METGTKKQRGRPVSGNAMSAAERMRRYRANKAIPVSRDELLIQVVDHVNDSVGRRAALLDVVASLMEAVDLPDTEIVSAVQFAVDMFRRERLDGLDS